MVHPILGLHHVTATVDDAQADLDFCIDLLGLRLVKRTVNFDNHDVYHFYYGTERGNRSIRRGTAGQQNVIIRRGTSQEASPRPRSRDTARIASYEQAGADPTLVDVCRTALGPRRAVHLRWAFM